MQTGFAGQRGNRRAV